MKEVGYLFAHFIGEEKDGEQIYFSLSRDGLHWQDLNQGRPVLRSNVGERGARDPFLLRSPFPEKEGEKYYLIATDLRIEAGKGWEAAQYEGSRDILVWESLDLVHWTGPFPRTVGVEGAGCVWAPEAFVELESPELAQLYGVEGPEEFHMGKTKKRHGGILGITEEEYQVLAAAWTGKDGRKNEA